MGLCEKESIGISWCRDRSSLVVHSVKEKDRAQEAGKERAL